ncbi:MAG: hypothetical protein RBS80_18825 [Thermoguttaceae bacterium]|jgi:Tfp pilus assembly protein PilF|nr:hypothetical protein [Thermoguttaceae bacterium]
MLGKWIFRGISTGLVAAALAVSPSDGQVLPDIEQVISGEMRTLTEEINYTVKRLLEVCGEAWQFDNLRPTVERAVWPEGTLWKPPRAPVIHLSPGSARYQHLVGEMAHWASLYDYRVQRLIELRREEKAIAEDPRRAIDVEWRKELYNARKHLDVAKAQYRRACAWAWCFHNLRPLVPEPGFEPATIINPFIPVPEVHLSEASPDYRKIVEALGQRQEGMQRWEQVVALREKGPPARPEPPPDELLKEDPRLAALSAMREKLAAELKESKAIAQDTEVLVASLQAAAPIRNNLRNEANRIQQGIAQRESILRGGRLEHDVAATVRAELAELQRALVRIQPLLLEAEQTVARMEGQMNELAKKQLQVVKTVDGLTLQWLESCDLFGADHAELHRRRLPAFARWIGEEADLWHLYLARGCSHLHAGDHQAAKDDFAAAVLRLRRFDPRPQVLALISMIEAYALNREGEHRLADAKARDAYRLDSKSAAVHVMRGRMFVERGQQVPAERDLKMARQLAQRNPAENELGALLLRLLPAAEAAPEHAAEVR